MNKNYLNYGLLFYGLFIFISIIVVIRISYINYVGLSYTTCYNMVLNIDSSSNTITASPNQNTRIMSNSDIVDYKFEFTLPTEKFQEIYDSLGTDITNNVITGSNSDYIINTYIIPLIQSNNTDSLIYELFTNFIS